MEKGQKITRKDVAALAGVSETIVSYVLGGKRYVKEEKKQRVLAAVEQLHYQPNNIARALHGKGSMQILFLAEELSSGYFAGLAGQMGKEAYENGYMISLCESRREEEFISRIISRQFDGLILSASGVTDNQLSLLDRAGIPMVVLESRRISRELSSAVFIDTGLYEGSRACVRYLAGSGCRNIIYLGKTEKTDCRDLHLSGFLEEMEECGLPVPKKYMLTGCRDEEEMEERLTSLLLEAPEADGIAARYDNLAAVALKAAKRAGRSVPGDLSVTGFDNDFISAYLSPALTTVEIHKEEVGKKAIEALLKLIRGEQCEKRLRCPTRLVVRDSTIKTGETGGNIC